MSDTSEYEAPEIEITVAGTRIIATARLDGHTCSALALCNPRDNFSEALGATIAAGRALKALGVELEQYALRQTG